MRIIVTGMSSLDNRVAKHIGLAWLSDVPPKEQTTARNSFRRECGQEYFCKQFFPEPGSDTPAWTGEQRDAILLMLFWELDRPIPVTAKVDPYPSTIQFNENVPELFLGTFDNPASARLS
ncbi:hypothetical protein [Ruegeria sp. Ofav3-42]|uniref:hypothetical protein n=1 Tax=Ruegeria sp. Ofav3-42 TaxID=2917759 RepID=UPI001EF72DF7|nr:hypothetical protein [Ruegeria sp. Ofav3-42]MCG7518782.1 hypothetical protein [Ruegeria sp. Ofav3-42]